MGSTRGPLGRDCSAEGVGSASILVGTSEFATAGDLHMSMSCTRTGRICVNHLSSNGRSATAACGFLLPTCRRNTISVTPAQLLWKQLEKAGRGYGRCSSRPPVAAARPALGPVRSLAQSTSVSVSLKAPTRGRKIAKETARRRANHQRNVEAISNTGSTSRTFW